MKVILKEPVGGLGRTGDVVDVKDGYARNYLIPRDLAEMATPGALKVWEQKRAVIEKKEAQERAEFEAIAEKINEKEVTVEAKAGEEGKLYGSVTSKEIASAIKNQLGIEVDRKKVELDVTIKDLGTYPALVRLYPGVDATVQVNVVASKEE